MQLSRRIRSVKTDEMHQLFVFCIFFKLAIVSSTSTGYSMLQNSYKGERSSYGSNNNSRAVYYYYQLPTLIASSTTTPRPSTINNNPRRNFYDDTCGGTVYIPLSFNRLLPYKSTHFPLRRDYPIICNWNFTVKHENCRRARLTMRLDGRSRLPDMDGCSKGYYTVSPNMKGARICGRLGNVPAYIWYVDRQLRSDVTVVTMKNLGINDGYFEGLSFTLLGECVENELLDPARTDVGKKNTKLNRRWMNRVFEDFQVGEGARIYIKPRPKRPPTTADSNNNSATRATAVISNVQNNTGIIQHWSNLKSQDQTIIPPRLEYTTTVPSTTEPINQPNITNLFYQTTSTSSTPLVMATTSNVDVLSTASSTSMGALTTPLSASVIRTTLTQSTLLFDVATTTSTTEKSDSVQNDVDVPHISGHEFVFSLLQETLQRTFLKFLKLFS